MDTEMQMMAEIERNMVSDELSLRDLVRILLQRAIWIVGVFAIVMVAVFLYLQVATPQYESQTTILVESLQQSSVLELIVSDRNISEALKLLDLSHYQNKKGVDYRELLDISKLKGHVSVAAVKSTNVVEIKVTDANAQFAADFANALVRSYETVQQAFIEAQIPLNEKQLLDVALAIVTFQDETNMFRLTDKSQLPSQKSAFFEFFRDPLMLQLNESIGTVEELRSRLFEAGYRVPSYDEVISDTHLTALTDYYDRLYQETILYRAVRYDEDELDTRRYSLMSSTSHTQTELLNRILELLVTGDYNGEMTSDPYLKLQTNALAQALGQRLMTEIELGALAKVELSYSDQLSQLPTLERMQFDFEREVQVLETLRLLELLEVVKIAETAMNHNVTVVDAAQVSLTPESPKKMLILAVGALIGLGLGVLTAFFIEMLDDTIKDELTIRRLAKSNVPMLGWTPLTNYNLEEKVPKLPVHNCPSSFEAERYKLIARNILFRLARSNDQVITIASAGMGEGKTMVTANVASALAQNNNSILIIDGDLRLSQQEDFFNLEKSNLGLVEVIRGEKRPEEVIVQPLEDLPTLHLLPPGSVPSIPSTLFTSTAYTTLLDDLREQYDYILINTPPLTFASELMEIAQKADAMIAIVRAGVTGKGSFAELMDNLKLANINVIGTVFNGVLERHSGGIYCRGRYYRTNGSSTEEYSKNSQLLTARGNYRSNYRRTLRLCEKRQRAERHVPQKPLLKPEKPARAVGSSVQVTRAKN